MTQSMKSSIYTQFITRFFLKVIDIILIHSEKIIEKSWNMKFMQELSYKNDYFRVKNSKKYKKWLKFHVILLKLIFILINIVKIRAFNLMKYNCNLIP